MVIKDVSASGVIGWLHVVLVLYTIKEYLFVENIKQEASYPTVL